jgi:hypothetical protein
MSWVGGVGLAVVKVDVACGTNPYSVVLDAEPVSGAVVISQLEDSRSMQVEGELFVRIRTLLAELETIPAPI